jgi:hypothetical protein
MRIKVCIPYYAEYKACESGIAELEACTEHEFVIKPKRGSVVSDTRNFLVNEGKSTKIYQQVSGFDAYLFIDSDVEFTLDNILHMIKFSLTKPDSIIALPYETFSGSGIYQVGEWKIVEGHIKGKYKATAIGWKKVSWIGGGLHLTPATAYSKIEYPWYRHHLVRYMGNQSQTSEDLGFCIVARQANVSIYCGFDHPVIHHKEQNTT